MKPYAVIVDWTTDSASIFEYDTEEEAQRNFNKMKGVYIDERLIFVNVLGCNR